MPRGSPHAIDELLRHAGFLRELARELVSDATSADDLVQEVWLQTLRTPPRDTGSPRGWLATVARRLASNTRRTDRRRRAREIEVAPPEPSLTPKEVLAREQTREVVVRAVLAIDEPFREAILLRFYEGLTPREIAQRLRIPAATVRTRIKRGLDRLAQRLDHVHDGDRSRWVTALLPFWSPAKTGVASVAAILIVMKKIVLPLVALLLLAVAVRVFSDLGRPSSPPDLDPKGPTAAVANTRTGGDLDRGEIGHRTEVALAQSGAVAVDSTPRVFPADRGTGSLSGRLVDEADHPCADVEVQWLPETGSFPPGLAVVDDRQGGGSIQSDGSGRFAFVALPCGPVVVEARRGSSIARAALIIGTDDQVIDLKLAPMVEPGDDLRVTVVDAQGRPAASAQVEVFAWSWRTVRPEVAEESRRSPIASGVADREGVFPLSGAGIDSGVVLARGADGRVGSAALWNARSGPWTIVVTLGEPGRVRGSLRGVDDEALRGARLGLHQLAAFDPYYTSGGRRIDVVLAGHLFEVDGLPPGRYGVSFDVPPSDQGGVRLVTQGVRWGNDVLDNSIEMPTFEVRNGDLTQVDLPVTNGGSIRGIVTCNGRPVAGARVQAVLAPATPNYPDGFEPRGVPLWRLDANYENAPHNPISHRLARTDAEGRYEIPGLAPGRWRVEVSCSSLSYDSRSRVRVDDGKRVELQHELVPAGVLQVATLDVGWLGVIRGGATDPVMIAVTRRDFVTFPGLAPGEYMVAGFHSDASVPPVPIATVTVVAGRTTWADLRSRCVRGVIRGVVRAGAQPIVGAQVRLYPRMSTTAADGGFELKLAHPVSFRGGFGASLEVGWRGWQYGFVPEGDDPVSDLDVVLQLGDQFADLEVIDAQGRACAGSVQLDWQSPDSRSSLRRASLSTKLPADGRLHIGPLPPGSLQGSVALDGGPSLPIVAKLPQAGPIRLVVPSTGTLQVLVTKGGKPLESARVDAGTFVGEGAPPEDFDTLGERGSWVQGRTDRDGRVTLEVVAGEVFVRAGTGDFAGIVSAPKRVHVAVGGRAQIELGVD